MFKRILLFIVLTVIFTVSVFAEDAKPVDFPIANEVKAFWITAGEDYAAKNSDTEETVKKQIDAIIKRATEYEFNTLFVPLEGADGVIYTSSVFKSFVGFDAFAYIVTTAKTAGLFVYPVFNPSYQMVGEDFVSINSITSKARTAAAVNLEDFLKLYDVDAVFFDGYDNVLSENSMAIYRSEGGGMGYKNWVFENSSALVSSLSSVVKSSRPGAGVGIVTSPVWANSVSTPEGSDTLSDYEMLQDGNVDINKLCTLSPIDVLLVKAPGSLSDETVNFTNVLSWWGNKGGEYGLPVVALIHNQNLGSSEDEGWKSPDQVMRQVIATRDIEGVSGAAFYSYKKLVDNPENSTDVLIKYYKNMIRAADILTDLAVSRPEKLQYTTYEPQVSFYGASDPNFPIKLNGSDILRNEKGVFSLALDLKPGLNTFTFFHKEKQVEYKITREVQIFQSVSPSGAVTVEGGTQLTFSAVAYKDSTVVASINGSSVPLSLVATENDNTDKDSGYVTYMGNYTVQNATNSSISIGNITFTGTWNGITQTKQGAIITVASGVMVDNGNLVVVTAEQARTYPANTLNADPWGNHFPLPRGTIDYVVSDLLTFQSSEGTYSYYKLKSGVRVNASDVSSEGVRPGLTSTLSEANFTADARYIYLTLRGDLKMPFVPSLSPMSFNNNTGLSSFVATNFSILLKYSQLSSGVSPINTVNTVFAGISLQQQGEDVLISMPLSRSGGFMGYVAYYDGDTLVFRFSQRPSSAVGLRVYIDPGHGGGDPGAIPIPGMKSEKDLNFEMSQKVAELLRAAGADVKVTDTGAQNPSLDSRIAAARSYSPHVFVSLHHNSSTSPSAAGSEVWYFNPYSLGFAGGISSRVAGSVATNNRGAKYGWYKVTSHTEFPAMLVEFGFLSNPTEYEKLKSTTYQNAMAQAVVDGIIAGL